MRQVVTGVLVAVAVLASVAGVTVAGASSASGSAPLAEAGLDQRVSVGTSVRLDATGSRDPDGSIVDYEWRIERPNGTTGVPTCRSCARTRFRPYRTGNYSVTVRVRDADGNVATDTLRVAVDPGDGPSVTLVGPRRPVTGTTQSYVARVSAGDVPLDRVQWRSSGRRVGTGAVTGDRDRARLDRSVTGTSTRTLRVKVTDVAGQTATAALTIQPVARLGGDPPGGSTSASGRDNCRNVRVRSGNSLDCGVTTTTTTRTQVVQFVQGGELRFARIERTVTRHEGISVQEVDSTADQLPDSVTVENVQVSIFKKRSAALPGESNTEKEGGRRLGLHQQENADVNPEFQTEERQVSLNPSGEQVGIGKEGSEFSRSYTERGETIYLESSSRQSGNVGSHRHQQRANQDHSQSNEPTDSNSSGGANPRESIGQQPERGRTPTSSPIGGGSGVGGRGLLEHT